MCMCHVRALAATAVPCRVSCTRSCRNSCAVPCVMYALLSQQLGRAVWSLGEEGHELAAALLPEALLRSVDEAVSDAWQGLAA